MKSVCGMMLVAVLLAACAGGPRVSSEPPDLQLDLLALEGERAQVVALIHNPNDHPVQIVAIELRMEFEDQLVFDQAWDIDLMMDARGRERVSVAAQLEAAAIKRLKALESGEYRNLGYRLTGRVELAGQRNASVDRSGFLHPVPGQSDQFR